MTKQATIIENLVKKGYNLQSEYNLNILTYETEKGLPCVCAYTGKTKVKPSYHFSFKTIEERQVWIDKRVESARAEEKRLNDYIKALKAESDKIHEGSILCCSWGFEQTNIDWFVVVSRKNTTLVLQQVEPILTHTGDMVGTSLPSTIKKGETFKKRINKFGLVKIKDYATAKLWDGESERFSTYA